MELKLSYDAATLLDALEIVSGIPPEEAARRALSIGLRAMVEEARSTKPWQNAKVVKYWEKALVDLEGAARIRPSPDEPALYERDPTHDSTAN